LSYDLPVSLAGYVGYVGCPVVKRASQWDLLLGDDCFWKLRARLCFQTYSQQGGCSIRDALWLHSRNWTNTAVLCCILTALSHIPGGPPTAGFVAGERADALKDVPPQVAVSRFVEQLDAIFGSPDDPCPASAAFVKGQVFDWSKEPWVGGAYTYPSLGAEVGDREALLAPVAGTLFFAGEAAHPAVNPCMQAALETGQWAAERVAAALKGRALSRL